jgi:hypothetical protein
VPVEPVLSVMVSSWRSGRNSWISSPSTSRRAPGEAPSGTVSLVSTMPEK